MTGDGDVGHMRAQCELRVKCGLYATTDRCWERFYKSCPDVTFAAGSTRTPAPISACSEAWRQLSCDDLRHERFPACASPGTRAAGEKCLFGAQCASRSCSSNGSDQCGVCAALLSKGEACVAGDPERKCGPGLRCDESFKVCAELVSLLPLGAVCNGRDECQAPYLCARGADAGYVCSPPPRLGQPCAELGCAKSEDIYCDATSRVCTKTPGADAPCRVQADSTALACDRSSFCDMTLAVPRCRSNPRLGEACTGGCVDDAKCSCVDSACSARRCLLFREQGESCDPQSFTTCAEPVSRCEGGKCVLISAPQGLFEKACGP